MQRPPAHPEPARRHKQPIQTPTEESEEEEEEEEEQEEDAWSHSSAAPAAPATNTATASSFKPPSSSASSSSRGSHHMAASSYVHASAAGQVRSAPAARPAPSTTAAPASAPHLPDESLSSSLDSSLSLCSCDAFHSLRCNDKIYSMLHNPIEIDEAGARIARAAVANRQAERRRRQQLLGEEEQEEEEASPDSSPPDPWSSALPSASLRYHLSDFTLGNLKNQSTRVVLPPTIIFSHQQARATEYYFTSMQSGSIRRKSKAKTQPKQVLEDLVGFAKMKLSQAMASLGKHADTFQEEEEDRAWEMEKEEYTNQIVYGSKEGTGRKRATAGASSTSQANLPHYMTAIRPPARKSPLVHSSGPPLSRSGSRTARLQHPLTSSPSTPPQQHCEIIAQFTFASDQSRLNNPFLPYTQLPPPEFPHTSLLSFLDPHRHPDILYFNIRSLHHFLTVVNADFDRPRACGVLQPFVVPREERNTVYRASFTTLPEEGESEASGRITEAASLPTAFHISVEGRQNVLKLNDRSGLSSAAASAASLSSSKSVAIPHTPHFTLAERAVTFDASHLSLQVEKGRGKEQGAEDKMKHPSHKSRDFNELAQPKDIHVLYPQLPSALLKQPIEDRLPTGQPSAYVDAASDRASSIRNSSTTTLVLPSSYPFSPSAATATNRIVVPSSLQERLRTCMMRIVGHLNELYRMSERKEREKRERQVALQKELYGRHAEALGQLPPLLPPSPSVTVGYLECFFKLDSANNLYLLTARSLKHLIREVEPEQVAAVAGKGNGSAPAPPLPAVTVRCAQCYRMCEKLPEAVAAKKNALVRPTSAVIAEQARTVAQQQAHSFSSQPPSSSSSSSSEYVTPFYARHRYLHDEAAVDDADEQERRARARRRSTSHPSFSAARSSAIVYGLQRKKNRGQGDSDEEEGAQDEDPDLWPESHFNPPSPPTDKWKVHSERLQANPLFDAREQQRITDDQAAEEEVEQRASEEEESVAYPTAPSRSGWTAAAARSIPLDIAAEDKAFQLALSQLTPEEPVGKQAGQVKRSGKAANGAKIFTSTRAPPKHTRPASAISSARAGRAAVAPSKLKSSPLGESASHGALSARAPSSGSSTVSACRPQSARHRPPSVLARMGMPFAPQPQPPPPPPAAAAPAPSPHVTPRLNTLWPRPPSAAPSGHLRGVSGSVRKLAQEVEALQRRQQRTHARSQSGHSPRLTEEAAHPVSSSSSRSSLSKRTSAPTPSSSSDIRFYNVHFSQAASSADLQKLSALYPQLQPALQASSASSRSPSRSSSRRSSAHALLLPPPSPSDEDAEDSLGDFSVEIEENQE